MAVRNDPRMRLVGVLLCTVGAAGGHVVGAIVIKLREFLGAAILAIFIAFMAAEVSESDVINHSQVMP